MRGIFHLHTRHSFDSMTSPAKIVDVAIKNKLDLLLIADHDTLAGSIEAKEIAREKNPNLQVPIAGEFFTDVGDIIVADVPVDFAPSFDHKDLCKRAKKAGGFTVLPHPLDGHHLEKIDFTCIDCIEIFNSRSRPEHDVLSKELAQRHQKPVIYGADAHFSQDLLNCLFEWEGPLLSPSFMKPIRLVKTPSYRKSLSQAIKGIKQKDPALFARSLIRALKKASSSSH
ncbi:PHP domain-containing protein [Estrella lausannensis]|uniref:Polymerase/histidinol phosphatase N-terminal domain-containing protein n=1 Tax=Estrella lausannensis TaxID=483423 RepID=A0A0H5DQ52_9BACT|nr:PHP domain-containing protein [Estrella lausannensis]CRX38761.1 hypothetical protein ELAC_1425 [Estrella lausannensis]